MGEYPAKAPKQRAGTCDREPGFFLLRPEDRLLALAGLELMRCSVIVFMIVPRSLIDRSRISREGEQIIWGLP